jgi:small subunit ribosomal protein S6
MTLYDCTFILHPQVEESGLDGYIKEARDLIVSNGGQVTAENRMGMRRMAYEIQKINQAYYVSLVFEGDGRTVSELERFLRLSESCLRFLTCLAPRAVVETANRKRTLRAKAQEKQETAAEPETSENTEKEETEVPEAADREQD